ncbi:hypothetical protein Taro_055896 [Colocasia esculenta]|uniref:Uncharacterized protein n=1 Tax=Colocasia esculenta TaxID=4460 RepID=A0A843XS45_COLES|nr:hypothetical protein [Colocasia esculenta]
MELSTNLACSGVMPNTLEIHTDLRRLNVLGFSSQDWICTIYTGIKSRDSLKTQKVPTDISDWRRNGSGYHHRLVYVDSHISCRQLLSSHNQFLGSKHYLSTDQGRLSTGEDHLSTDGSYLSIATGGFALSGFWKHPICR